MFLFFKGAGIVKSLSARDPSALGLDTYCKQYYLCLAAVTATIKWYVCSTHYDSIMILTFIYGCPVKE
jgi:DNA mismatch repair protein MSH4